MIAKKHEVKIFFKETISWLQTENQSENQSELDTDKVDTSILISSLNTFIVYFLSKTTKI